MLRSIRNAFITGLLVILPMGITLIVINFLLERLGTPASQFFFWYLDPDLRKLPSLKFALEAISVFVVFTIITFLGLCSRFVIGRIILNKLELLLEKVPLISTVYGTVKQIVDTFNTRDRAIFQEVVLVEYPRKGCFVIGFLTGATQGETQEVTEDHTVNVFVPTTPNPTSGFLLLLPEKDITRLQMNIADGIKLIISGGAVVPNHKTGVKVLIENPTKAESKAHINRA